MKVQTFLMKSLMNLHKMNNHVYEHLRNFFPTLATLLTMWDREPGIKGFTLNFFPDF